MGSFGPWPLKNEKMPLGLIHLRNMTTLTEAGAVILPASPGFYNRPATLDDLGRFIAGRILTVLGVRHDLYPPWNGDNDIGDNDND